MSANPLQLILAKTTNPVEQLRIQISGVRSYGESGHLKVNGDFTGGKPERATLKSFFAVITVEMCSELMARLDNSVVQHLKFLLVEYTHCSR